MNVKKFNPIVFVLVFAVFWIVPVSLSAQIFDYHKEESGAISWNDIPIFDARMLGAGGISLLGSPGFAASINPALLAGNNDFIVSGSGQIMNHEAFQYWGLNEGVLFSSANQGERNYSPSGLTVVFPFKGIYWSAGWFTPNLLELPSFRYAETKYSYTGDFKGSDHSFFAAGAFKLSKKVNIGLKLEYIYSMRDVQLEENMEYYPAVINQEERHRSNALVPTFGITYHVSPKWTLGASAAHCISGTANRTLDRIFTSKQTVLEIKNLKADDPLSRPTRFTFGASFIPLFKTDDETKEKKVLTLAGEIVYVLWKNYEYTFFSEILPRDMRNTLIIAVGGEWVMYSKKNEYLLRLGGRIDPQPLQNPGTNLYELTGGVGFRNQNLHFDIGMMYCSGSTAGFSQKHWILNSTVGIRLGGQK